MYGKKSGSSYGGMGKKKKKKTAAKSSKPMRGTRMGRRSK